MSVSCAEMRCSISFVVYAAGKIEINNGVRSVKVKYNSLTCFPTLTCYRLTVFPTNTVAVAE